MIDNKTRLDLLCAIEHERDAAIEKHGHFHSHHEAYAVLLEEVEEVTGGAQVFTEGAEFQMQQLWQQVRADMQLAGNPKARLQEIKRLALDLSCECVQVAAMCDKWGLLLESEAAASEIAK